MNLQISGKLQKSSLFQETLVIIWRRIFLRSLCHVTVVIRRKNIHILNNDGPNCVSMWCSAPGGKLSGK
jgi:hypothetical protein